MRDTQNEAQQAARFPGAVVNLEYQRKADRLDYLVVHFGSKTLETRDPVVHHAWIRAYYLRNYMRSRSFGRDGKLALDLYLEVCAIQDTSLF